MRFYLRRLVALLFVLGLCTAAFADGSHDRTQVGHDIVIGSNEEITDATCFGCSVRVRGHLNGDATAFGGSVIVEDQGEINGDVTVFGGGVRLSKEVKVRGDITAFGGRVRRDPGASVGGDISSFGNAFWILVVFALPFVILAGLITFVIWAIRRLIRPAVLVGAQPAPGAFRGR